MADSKADAQSNPNPIPFDESGEKTLAIFDDRRPGGTNPNPGARRQHSPLEQIVRQLVAVGLEPIVDSRCTPQTVISLGVTRRIDARLVISENVLQADRVALHAGDSAILMNFTFSAHLPADVHGRSIAEAICERMAATG